MEINDRDYRRAKKKVKRKKGFRSHFSVYVGTSIFFILLNAFSGDTEFWAIFPIISWGLGVFFHYTSVYGFPGLKKQDHEWEREEIKRELRHTHKERQMRNKTLGSGQEQPDFEENRKRPDHQELELEDLDELLDLIEEKEKIGKRR